MIIDYFSLGPKDIMNVPTSKSTQLIIGAMQSCENYDGTSRESFTANLISGYPRTIEDIEDYMAKVSFMLNVNKGRKTFLEIK